MKILDRISELIYPEKNICFICDEYEDAIKNHLCIECRDKLEFLEQTISEDIVCPLRYTDGIREIIFKYKYGKNPYLYKMLGPLLLEEFIKRNINDIDLIVPIPMTRRKKSKRGFNQSELLAKYLSEKLNIELDTRNLVKFKKTKSQSGLSKSFRRVNIRGAFKTIDKEIFADKNVLIVDDIITTGATYTEAKRNIMDANAKKTYLITIASGRDI